jgi:hypothetical protein
LALHLAIDNFVHFPSHVSCYEIYKNNEESLCKIDKFIRKGGNQFELGNICGAIDFIKEKYPKTVKDSAAEVLIDLYQQLVQIV